MSQKKFLSVFLAILLLSAMQLSATRFFTDLPENQVIEHAFDEAYREHPRIPHGLLEAISYSKTRIKHRRPTAEDQSCMGIPQAYGVMGLILDGKSYFRNNLQTVAELSGTSQQKIITDPRMHVLAYAAAFEELILQSELPTTAPVEAYDQIILALSELPERSDMHNDFAINAFLYELFSFINDPNFQQTYELPSYFINTRTYFGDNNYEVLSASRLYSSDSSISDDKGNSYEHTYRAGPCYEFPGVTWVAADASNYSSRNGTAITHLTIHTMQGTYPGAISWFQNPSANVSAHYCMRASDGQVTQMVCEADKAWHVSNSNPYAIGIEHDGYVDDPSWYTDITYTTSAAMAIDIANEYGMPLLETYDGPGSNSVDPISDGCFSIKGHGHFPNQSHYDPGALWDWNRYYDLINPPNTTNHSSCSGTLLDPGGTGNYSNNVRATHLIKPTGASSVTLTFNSFNLELNYDYLYVYDGDNHDAPLIATLNGTSLPSPITANSGAMYLDFRSDCGTTSPGWDADWSCSTATAACSTPTNLYVDNISPFYARLNWNAVPGASNYEVRVKWSMDANWTTYNTSSTSFDVSGLGSASFYIWQVKATCGAGASTYAASNFVTDMPTVVNYIANTCTGDFLDTGGAQGKYRNNEDYVYTIAPVSTTDVTVNFSSFDIEANYDYLDIFDGPSSASPLMSTHTGTNSPGTVTSSGSTISFRFTSDNATIDPGWIADWNCTAVQNCNPLTTINAINGWQTTDFTASFNDIDDCLVGFNKRYYKALELQSGEWRANTNNGYFNDDFDAAVHADWTSSVGSWSISSQAMYQSDASNSNTNIYAPLVQDNSHAYLYHYEMKISGSGSNRRAGIHFFSDDGSKANRGNSYFIYYRADSDKVQIYKVTNDSWALQSDDVFTIDPNIWYDIKIAYDPNSGEIKTYVNDVLASSWTDPSPWTTGNHISLRTGNCLVHYNFMRSYKSRAASSLISVGPAANDDMRFENPSPSVSAGKVTSIFVDNNHNWSNYDEELVDIEFTPPTDPIVQDGTGVDLDVTTDLTQLSGNWSNSTDPSSGVSEYWYAVGTSPGGTDVIGWTNNGMSTNFTQTGLSLINGMTYYISVRVKNGAGLFSVPVVSDGLTVTILSPAEVFLELWLEGPYAGGMMTTDLQANGLLPTSQPFAASPFNYSGSESLGSNTNIVDWVLVEIRDAGKNVLETRAALLRNDGKVIDVDGTTGIQLNTLEGDYYVSVRARNHLALLSSNAVTLPNPGGQNFSQASSVSGGTAQLVNVGGKYLAPAGDFDGNAVINFADFNEYMTNTSSIFQYVEQDCNMDGHTTVADYNLYKKNAARMSVSDLHL